MRFSILCEIHNSATCTIEQTLERFGSIPLRYTSIQALNFDKETYMLEIRVRSRTTFGRLYPHDLSMLFIPIGQADGFVYSVTKID